MKKASLEEVLAYREKRARRRQEFLSEYPFPLVCLCLNIPGEYKDFPWAQRCFREEIETFALALEAEGVKISHRESEEENSGYTAYISAAADAAALKTLALRIEETHPLGRLFDIDIYEPGGRKLSRQAAGQDPGGEPSARPCLVCGGDAFACGRSRVHPPEQLHRAVMGIMEAWFRQNLGDRICSAAAWAMMSEAAITPKPGLVDRAHSGAHSDMDFFTFIDSASALLPWFRFCALAGFDSGVENHALGGPAALFEALRPPGRMAEVLMKRATGGVNTHRGYIFSLGILSAAYGRLYRDAQEPGMAGLLEFTKAMTRSLGEDFSRSRQGGAPIGEITHGQAVYAARGVCRKPVGGFPGGSSPFAGAGKILPKAACHGFGKLQNPGGAGLFRAPVQPAVGRRKNAQAEDVPPVGVHAACGPFHQNFRHPARGPQRLKQGPGGAAGAAFRP
jgi:holo-ACP synthase/triphosphoribosyl-dephospho-CoA synthase